MPADDPFKLPHELKRILAFFVRHSTNGQIHLNFTEGKLVNFDFKIHSKVPRAWPDGETAKKIIKEGA